MKTIKNNIVFPYWIDNGIKNLSLTVALTVKLRF